MYPAHVMTMTQCGGPRDRDTQTHNQVMYNVTRLVEVDVGIRAQVFQVLWYTAVNAASTTKDVPHKVAQSPIND